MNSINIINVINEMVQLVVHPVSIEKATDIINSLDIDDTVKLFCLNLIIANYSNNPKQCSFFTPEYELDAKIVAKDQSGLYIAISQNRLVTLEKREDSFYLKSILSDFVF